MKKGGFYDEVDFTVTLTKKWIKNKNRGKIRERK